MSFETSGTKPTLVAWGNAVKPLTQAERLAKHLESLPSYMRGGLIIACADENTWLRVLRAALPELLRSGSPEDRKLALALLGEEGDQ